MSSANAFDLDQSKNLSCGKGINVKTVKVDHISNKLSYFTGVCERCGYISSNPVCKACVMLEGLNKGLPRLGIGKTHKERRKVC